MKTNMTLPNYKSSRFTPKIICHVVGLYFHFALYILNVEELLAQRRIVMIVKRFEIGGSEKIECV